MLARPTVAVPPSVLASSAMPKSTAKPTGDQAVAAAHAHERGYRDYQQKGLTARNPYDPVTTQFSYQRWQEGFNKARGE